MGNPRHRDGGTVLVGARVRYLCTLLAMSEAMGSRTQGTGRPIVLRPYTVAGERRVVCAEVFVGRSDPLRILVRLPGSGRM